MIITNKLNATEKQFDLRRLNAKAKRNSGKSRNSAMLRKLAKKFGFELGFIGTKVKLDHKFSRNFFRSEDGLSKAQSIQEALTYIAEVSGELTA